MRHKKPHFFKETVSAPMGFHLKGQWVFWLSASLCLLLLSLVLAVLAGRSPEPLGREDFIRFHVIADSDSPEDQAVKLKVRDAVLARLTPDLMEMTSMENTRAYIEDNKDRIRQVAKAALEEAGVKDEVRTSLGLRWIPEKTYGSVTFPAGVYEAFTVEIGRARGQNWWCVLFPPLCLIDEGKEGEKEEAIRDLEQEMSRFIAGKYEPLIESARRGEPLVLKFKTAEVAKTIEKRLFYN